jgi:NADPH:quinone reductase-like Zn-dependent oxidoreductase
VFGSSRLRESGAFAPTVLTDEALLAERPAGLSAEQAACLPIPAITAWRGLFQKTSLQAGQSVYVHGCTGAVGHSAVQLALNAGATVAGSCSAANRQAALDTGVQPVLDYASQKPGDLGRTFDVVFDTAGSLPIANALALTAPRGAVLDINPTPSRLMRGLWSRRYRMVFGQSSVDLLERVAVLAAAGTLHFPIGKRVGLAEAIDVIKDLEAGLRLPGRVIISMT